MYIEKLEDHRLEKMSSLLTDKLQTEKALLYNAISKIDFNSDEKKRITDTLNFAMKQYYGESLLCKYYVSHPIRVTRFILEWMEHYHDKNIDLVVASLIHNALEKNIMSPYELEQQYGKWIKETIEILTVNREEQNTPGWSEEYYGGVAHLDKYGQLLKLFDKFDNIYALCLNPDSMTRNEYLDDIERYIRPILIAHSPHLEAYFDELVSSTKKLGYLSIEHFQKKFHHPG